MDVIQTSGLTKRYGQTRGIENLDLRVQEGEFFGFIGPNGAGKSTTIRTLLGLIAPTSGEARVLGLNVQRERNRILSEVGYLPSEIAFYPGMRVREVLELSAGLRGKPCRAEEERLCERLRLDTGRRVEELSLGNRKKVAIVCALMHMPRLLILDEPTSGLDPLMQHEFFSLLGERNRQGTTVFLSSHVLSEVQKHCTRAAMIREGRLIACDSVEALCQTRTKRVVLRGTADLCGLEGIRDVQRTEDGMSFLYGGEMYLLLRRLSAGSIEDLSVVEPDLEEVFLQDYENGGKRR